MPHGWTTCELQTVMQEINFDKLKINRDAENRPE